MRIKLLLNVFALIMIATSMQEVHAQRKFLRKNGYNPTALGNLMKTKDNDKQIQDIGIGEDKSFKVAYKKARLDLNANLAIKVNSRLQSTQNLSINSNQNSDDTGMGGTDTSTDFQSSELSEADAILSRVEKNDNIQGIEKKTGMWMIYLKGEVKLKNVTNLNTETKSDQ